MPRPRTPKARARATGASVAHKERFEGRNEPTVADPVGEPFAWLKPNAQQAWKDLVDEIPWLNKSHRGILSIAAVIRGRMMDGDDCGVQAMNLLRISLGQMGASPADASKAGVMPGGEGEDPADKYF